MPILLAPSLRIWFHAKSHVWTLATRTWSTRRMKDERRGGEGGRKGGKEWEEDEDEQRRWIKEVEKEGGKRQNVRLNAMYEQMECYGNRVYGIWWMSCPHINRQTDKHTYRQQTHYNNTATLQHVLHDFLDSLIDLYIYSIVYIYSLNSLTPWLIYIYIV